MKKTFLPIVVLVIGFMCAPVAAGAWYSPTVYQPQYYPVQYTYAPAYSYSANQPGYYTYPSQQPYTYSYNYYPSYVQNSYDVYPPTYYGGYPTGDAVPWLGGQMCYYPNYGRSPCNFDPHQYIYDPWTGTWY